MLMQLTSFRLMRGLNVIHLKQFSEVQVAACSGVTGDGSGGDEAQGNDFCSGCCG